MTSAPVPVEPDHKTLENLRASIMDLVGQYSDLAHATKPFIGGTSPVPVSGRVFDSSDVKSLVDSALDFWLTAGRFNDQFQTGLAKRVGARYAMTVNSGSSANLVAFSALTSPLLRERQIAPAAKSSPQRRDFLRRSIPRLRRAWFPFLSTSIFRPTISSRIWSRRPSRPRPGRSWLRTR